MTEAQWLECNQPMQMLAFLRGRAGERELRLFACAAGRRLLHMLGDPRCRRAVEVAERHADGLADADELRESAAGAAHAAEQMTAARAAGWNAAITAAMTARDPWAAAERAALMAADAETVREVFGNPFRPPQPVEPAWLEWNGGTVRKLAQAAYDTRRFGGVPVLADALEEAGCTDAAVLEHLRGGGRHVRGCWAINLLLGKG